MKQCDKFDSQTTSLDPSLRAQRAQPLQADQGLLLKYREVISPKAINTLESIPLFQKAGIVYNPQKQFTPFKYKLLNHDKGEQILTLRSSIGPFEVDLQILLNLQRANPFQSTMQSQEGNYGHIYFLNMSGSQVAFKIIPNKETISIKANFTKLIKEVTIMKIASALECSVRMEKYLGFDIIVYQNEYMFAMEKGKAIKKASQYMCLSLKEGIETLHSYGIIHFDIKPENIIYSPYYGRAVFIDFGFADVVQERPGQKTLTSFRGTPKYCGQEMLAILVNHPTFIDVYYNDLFGFKQTLQTLKCISQEVDESQAFGSLDELGWIQMEDYLILLQLQLYVFQYCYFFRKYEDTVRILASRHKRLYKYKIHDVLGFIIRVFSIVFKQEVFQQLQQWNYLDQYQQIQRKIQGKASKLSSFCSHHFIVKSQEGQQKFSPFYRFHLNITQQDGSYIENSYGYHIINRLKSDILPQKGKISKRDYEILFHYLRFDIQNLSLSEKTVIAKKFKEIINESFEDDFSPPCKEIKFFFKYFLQRVILVEPMTELQKSHFYNVIYQLIILGVPFQAQFHSFINIIKRNFNNITQKCIMYFELYFIFGLVLSINLRQDTKDYYIRLHKLLVTTTDNLKEQIYQCPCLSKQQQGLVIIVKQLETQRLEFKKKQSSALFFSLSQTITNKTLYNLLQKMYCMTNLLFNTEKCRHQYLIAMVKGLSADIGQKNLIITIIMVKRISIVLKVYTELIEFSKKLREIIDCQQIYSRLDFQRYAFIMDGKSVDNRVIMGYVKDIDLCYYQYLEMESPINSTIYMIFSKLKASQLTSGDKAILQSLLQKIEGINEFSQNKIDSMMLYQSILQKIKILKQFADIGLKSKHLTLEDTLKQADYLTSKLKFQNNQTSAQMHFIMANTFKYLLLITQYFDDEMDPRQLIAATMKLQTIARQLGLKQIWYLHLHSIVQLANISKQLAIFQAYIENIFYLIAETKELSPFFFIQAQCWDLNIHLSYFAKYNIPQRLYRLLRIKAQWVCKNPFDAYVHVFRINVDRFCQEYPQSILFQSLNRQIPLAKIQENPYFILYYINTAYLEKSQIKQRIIRFITLHLQKLSIFAKKSILIKYYYIALTLPHFSTYKVSYLLYKIGKRYIQKSRYQTLRKNVEKQEERAFKTNNVLLLKLLSYKLSYLKFIY